MTRATRGWLPLAAVSLVLLAGCGDDPGPAPRAEEPTPTPSGPAEPGAGDAPVDAAVADLADRLDLAPEEIEVLESEAVTWRDGSLGCPQPGQVYTQALVEGHRVVLGAGRRTYPYHSGGGRGPFLCENLQPSIPPEPGAES